MTAQRDADRLILRTLGIDDEAPVVAAQAELAAEDFTFVFGPDDAAFADRLAALDRVRMDEGVTATDVPATFLGAFVDGELVGRVSIRHELSDELRREGGHIGYAVRPQFRRRGYAAAILRRALEVAHDLGIESALVTCSATNIGSKTAIERCGGVLDDSEEWRLPGKLRFWVPTEDHLSRSEP
jgi:predicted acetyltransferase